MLSDDLRWLMLDNGMLRCAATCDENLVDAPTKADDTGVSNEAADEGSVAAESRGTIRGYGDDAAAEVERSIAE